MKTIILCGGLGTRLREETEFRPKPMVNIGNRPILWHIMKIYAHYGYKDFILALGYKGEMIKEYFYHYELTTNDVTIELGKISRVSMLGAHDEAGWKITLADTGDKALKGARLKRIEKYIDSGIFMVAYGDNLADIDLRTLLKFHRRHGKLATLTGVNPTSRFGELKIKGNQVRSFIEKPSSSDGLINAGFFIFNKKIFQYLDSGDNCDLEIGALEKVARNGQLMVYKHTGFWACMDTLRDVDYLNNMWHNNKAKWKVW
jgi:glucose-1-phosphate cytidylyltransferase